MHAIVWRLICSIVTERRRKGSQYKTGHNASSGYAHFFIDLINENLRLETQRRRHYIGDQYRNDIQQNLQRILPTVILREGPVGGVDVVQRNRGRRL